MILDLDLNDPAHLKQAKEYVEREANRFPLVGFDIAKALLQHAEAALDFRQQVATELAGLLQSEETKIVGMSDFELRPAPHVFAQNQAIRALATRLGIELPT